MPEVIKKYVIENNFDSVRHEQEIILHAYQNDFVKHAEPTDVMKITDTWNSIPKQLAKDNKKFKAVGIIYNQPLCNSLFLKESKKFNFLKLS